MSNEIQAISSKLEGLKNKQSKIRLLKHVKSNPNVQDLHVSCSYVEKDDPNNEYYVCEEAKLNISYQYNGKTRRTYVHFLSTSPDEDGNRYQYTTDLNIEGTKEGPIFDELFDMLENPHDWKDFIKKIVK